MRRKPLRAFPTALLVMAGASWLHGCTGRPPASQIETASLTGPAAERNCLIRAMYFESNRLSRDGLMAVGTVVMNRVASPRFPDTICGVVSEPRQFAPGVMAMQLDPKQLPPVERAADAVLAGKRYAPIGDAMWFHVAGLEIPYRVQYMAVAGGNAFYRKTGRRFTNAPTTEVAMAQNAGSAGGSAFAAARPTLLERLFASAPAW